MVWLCELFVAKGEQTDFSHKAIQLEKAMKTS